MHASLRSPWRWRSLARAALLLAPWSAGAAEPAASAPAPRAASAASAASSGTSGPEAPAGVPTGGGAGGGAPSRPTDPSSSAELRGPYVVQQTRRIGREVLSGRVCALGAEFQVTFETPPVTFQLKLKPQPASTRSPHAAPQHGTWSYDYLLARAGESHDASGEYDIVEDLAARRLHLAMRGSDHVVFKGHDGMHPIDYGFDLVPTPGTACP